MDDRPFLEIDLRAISKKSIDELKKLANHTFDIETILATASDLKYTRGIKKILIEEWQNPSEEFVKLLAGRVYTGRFTQNAKEQFESIVKRAFHEFVNDRVNERLKSALEQTTSEETGQTESSESTKAADLIETTSDELEGFHIVRAIVSSIVEPKRVYIRDTQSYCGILLDDNNRKPICRMRFNSDHKRYLSVFDANRSETRHTISELTDLYKFAEHLRAVCTAYDSAKAPLADA